MLGLLRAPESGDLYSTPGPQKGNVLASEGLLGGPRGTRIAPGVSDLVPTATGRSKWAGLMVSTHFDLYVAAKSLKVGCPERCNLTPCSCTVSYIAPTNYCV